jgi:hypothetical protein
MYDRALLPFGFAYCQQALQRVEEMSKCVEAEGVRQIEVALSTVKSSGAHSILVSLGSDFGYAANAR